MRIWSIHPKYLDSKGLVALWRETLLAKKVLLGLTKGYKNHPQLIRFKNTSNPEKTINLYLYFVYKEGIRRDFSFNKAKFTKPKEIIKIKVSDKQISYEFTHLLKKLQKRENEKYDQNNKENRIEPHPMFEIKKGDIEKWEKVIKN